MGGEMMCQRDDSKTWLDYEMGYSDALLEDEYRALTGTEELMHKNDQKTLTKAEAETELFRLRMEHAKVQSLIQVLTLIGRDLFNMARGTICIKTDCGYGTMTDFEDDSVTITNSIEEVVQTIGALSAEVKRFEETYIRYDVKGLPEE